jgi:predicted hotdog family 3-hydroxylacyl-ACP dehydratase
MLLDRSWIERHIPHQGRMCLLDAVTAWDAARIVCRTASHRAEGNPMRKNGRLGIVCGIEYAAQSMAVHGALLAGAADPAAATTEGDGLRGRPAAGFLAALRGVRWRVARLDDIEEDLICEASRVAGDGGSALYEFVVRAAAGELISGRATVMLNGAERFNP